jgi:NAD(P)H-hydrate epimerase
MKVLLSPWMKELDSVAIHEVGIPSIVLMENASQGAAAFFARRFPQKYYKHVIAVIGKGNNGGDGIAVGRILSQWGYNVRFLFLADPESLNPDPKINFDIIKKLGLDYRVIEDSSELNELLQDCHHGETFVIDAIFGIGINKPLREGIYTDIIRCINDSPHAVAAIDIPSGLSDEFLPEEGVHVVADVTATFQNLKWAHLMPDGNKYCGKIEIVDIGIPTQLQDNPDYFIEMIEPSGIKELFAPRGIDAHKGRFGHCLTVCGSIDKPGAGILSSISTLKAGAGLCTAAVKKEISFPFQCYPEIMTLPYGVSRDIGSRLGEFDCVLIGPGCGNTPETFAIVSEVLEISSAPVILDADAVNVLENNAGILKKRKGSPVVLTPHPREFSRVTGLPVRGIMQNRVKAARDFAMDYGVYLVLKGHHTLIATPEGRVFVNQTGNPGMATAGSGDVLGGMLAGFIAQFVDSFDIQTIVNAGVFIHGLAGDIAAGETGELSLTATDIIEHISAATRNLNEYKTRFSFSRADV